MIYLVLSIKIEMQKRTKIGLLSVTMGVLLLLSPALRVANPALFAVLAASILYFGLYWVLEFSVIGLRLIFVFILPIIFTFLFIQRILGVSLGVGVGISLPLAVLFAVLVYVLVLTANILNVASIKKIPLLQVAQTSLYFFTTITVFLMFDAVQSLEASTVLDTLIISVSLFVLIYQLFWFIFESRKDLLQATLVTDFLLVLAYFIISFFPIPYLLFNVVLSALFYIFIGLFMHSIKKSLVGNMVIEYILIIIALILLTVISFDWGSF